jgi:hypothetical protein
MLLEYEDGGIVSHFVEDEDVSHGIALSIEEAENSPLASLVHEITQFILDNDPHICRFLAGCG